MAADADTASSPSVTTEPAPDGETPPSAKEPAKSPRTEPGTPEFDSDIPRADAEDSSPDGIPKRFLPSTPLPETEKGVEKAGNPSLSDAGENLFFWGLAVQTKLEPGHAEMIEGMTAGFLDCHSGRRIYLRRELAELMSEQGEGDFCPTFGTDCLSLIGRADLAKEAVAGEIGKLGRIWVVNLRRVSVPDMTVIRRASRQVEGSVADLAKVLDRAAAELFDSARPSGPVVLLGESGQAIPPTSTETPRFEEDEDDGNAANLPKGKTAKSGKKAKKRRSGKAPNRMHFTLFGGLDAPMEGAKASGAMGGNIGFDLWDKIGFELLLSQTWGDVKADGRYVGTKILGIRPGVRYRFWGEEIRLYTAGHLGLSQSMFNPSNKTLADPVDKDDVFKSGFTFDGGLGVEFRIANILLIDLGGLFTAHFKNMPRNAADPAVSESIRTDGNYYGFLVTLGVGVSSKI